MTICQWKRIVEKHRISLCTLLILLYDDYSKKETFTTLYFSELEKNIDIDEFIEIDVIISLDKDMLELIKFILFLTKDKNINIESKSIFNIDINKELDTLYESLYISELIDTMLDRKKFITTNEHYAELKQRRSDKFGKACTALLNLHDVYVSPKQLIDIMTKYEDCRKFISKNLQLALQKNIDPVTIWEKFLENEQNKKTVKTLSTYLYRMQGKSWKEIASNFNVKERTAMRWIENGEGERLRQENGLPELPHQIENVNVIKCHILSSS